MIATSIKTSGQHVVNQMGLSREDTSFEPRYTVNELAALWKYSRETVRLVVKDEPGVLKFRHGLRKTKTRYSVPESVAKRIHTRLLNGDIRTTADTAI